MNLSIFIARRYLFSKKKQNAINIISIISMVGVAIGTTALIVVLSVFNGIDTLLVTNDCIQLKGYDCGFIGGCSFMLDKDSLALNGSLSCHPDGKRIKDFCMCHGVAFFEMSQGPLTDIGGGFVFP